MTAALVVIHLLLESSMVINTAQVEENWQKIYDVVHLMQTVGECMLDSVAAQAALLLHDMAGLRDRSFGGEDFVGSLPYFGRLYIRHGPKIDVPSDQDGEVIPCTAEDPASNLLTNFDDFAFIDSMDWLGDLNFSLLDDWKWAGNGSEEL